MKREEEAVLLRIFIGESDKYRGKPLYQYLLEMLRREGLSGATVFRGIAGFGKKSVLQTTSILRLSADLPIVIEVVDTREKIERIKPIIDEAVKEGLVTEEKVRVFLYEG
jgi:PII-like signaling protein